MSEPDAGRIRRLNEAFRRSLEGGMVIFTGALANTSPEGIVLQHKVLAAVRFAKIDPGNDPYGEADFGKVTIDAEEFFWKIDYYDLDLKGASEDPADPAVTKRVMSVFYASDY